MFKNSLLMISLIVSISAVAMDPKNPFHKTFEKEFNKTNEIFEKITSNASKSSSSKSSSSSSSSPKPFYPTNEERTYNEPIRTERYVYFDSGKRKGETEFTENGETYFVSERGTQSQTERMQEERRAVERRMREQQQENNACILN